MPLTPPDSEPDMTAKWSKTSLPEDAWYTGSAQDHSTYVQSSSSEWDAQTLFSSTQDFQSLDAFHWTNTTQGSVGAGLSPVMSHESSGSHALNSFSEAELPAGLDLSFTFEPTWESASSFACHDTQSTQRPLSGSTFVPSLDEMPFGPRMNNAMPQWSMDFGCSGQPMFYSQTGQNARPVVQSPAVAAQRTILPRTEGSMAASSPSFAPSSSQRPNRSIQGRASSQRSSQSVSNSAHPVPESPRIESGYRLAPRSVTSEDAKPSVPALESFQTGSQPYYGQRNYAQDAMSTITDPAAEEFTAFIHYDQDEQPATIGSTRSDSSAPALSIRGTNTCCSFSGSSRPSYALLSSKETSQGNRSKTQPDAKSTKASKSGTTLAGELDEGRHRNHPLYAKGPDADGLFRCPFSAKENCPHQATKLKCNYEYDHNHLPTTSKPLAQSNHHLLHSKFVDSHLKPFRCRQEACAKQEFSSTACLLRHEREAHGMHGHGDRPHLCFYAGCERGVPGNGFPRRYNLFDHMKRVHDHKEDSASASGLASPDPDAKKPAGHGRKRKAPSSTASEPAAHRLKISPQLTPPAPAQQVAPLPYHEVLPMTAATAAQGYPYALAQEMAQPVQWPAHGHGHMPVRNFDYVQSPQQEDAPVAMFDRHFQGVRRESNESRYG